MLYQADQASKRSFTITLVIFAITFLAALLTLWIYDSKKGPERGVNRSGSDGLKTNSANTSSGSKTDR